MAIFINLEKGGLGWPELALTSPHSLGYGKEKPIYKHLFYFLEKHVAFCFNYFFFSFKNRNKLLLLRLNKHAN